MSKIKKEDFILGKVNIIDPDGLEVEYVYRETENGECFNNQGGDRKLQPFHEDLKEVFKELKPILAKMGHYDFMSTIMEEPSFKPTKAQKEVLENFRKELYAKITVNGVSFSGTGDNVGCIIKGKFKQMTNKYVAFNSSRIPFNTNTLGIEEELKEISQRLLDEVYKYLFEGKRGDFKQLEIAFEEDIAKEGIGEKEKLTYDDLPTLTERELEDFERVLKGDL